MNATLKKSALWPFVKVMNLTRNMRVESLGVHSEEGREMQGFTSWLLKIGDGVEGGRLRIPIDMAADFDDMDALIQDIFPNLRSEEECLNSCILMPLNKDVNKMNSRILSEFPGLATNPL